MKKWNLTPLLAAFAAAITFLACQQPVSSPETATQQPTAKSSDATLASIGASYGGGTVINLSPAFDSATISYSGNVPTSIDSVTISAAAANAKATVTGTGASSLGAADTTTTKTITVTAEDGTTKTYTIAIHRASADASSDASLQSLRILVAGTAQTLSPAFATGTHDYTLTVPNYAAAITVEAATTDADANAGEIGTKALNVGANTITVTGTAKDGATTSTYTVVVTRDIPDSYNLGSLTSSAGILSPGLNAETSGYSITLPFGTSATTISASREYSGPTLEYSTDGTNYSQMTTGSFSVSGLAAGASAVVKIRCTSRAGASRDYEVTVQQAASAASSDATLSALKIETYYGNTNIPISPAFSSSVENYTASVSNGVFKLFVIPTKNDTNATCSVASYTIYPLTVGDNVIPVTVTAADGVTQKTYTITVTRHAAASATITSPAANSTVTPGTITVSGTYTDPVGDAVSAKLYWGNQTVTASINTTAKTFTGTLDLSLAANGPQPIMVSLLDSLNADIASGMTNVVVSGSSVEAYSISGNVYCTGNVTGTQYLYVCVMPDDSRPSPGTSRQIIFIPITSLPYTYTLTGITPGDYYIGAALFSEATIANDYLVASSAGPSFVTVTNADKTSVNTSMIQQ